MGHQSVLQNGNIKKIELHKKNIYLNPLLLFMTQIVLQISSEIGNYLNEFINEMQKQTKS